MKKRNNNYLYFSIITLILFTSGCVSYGISTLRLNYQPSINTKSSNSPAPNIKLNDFQDVRVGKNEPEIIGHREAAFGVSMGDVQVKRPIFEIIHNALSTELMQNGYSIVNTGEDFTITGKIFNFWVGTDVTALYWDVYGEVRIAIDIKNTNGEITQIGPYYAKNIERTYKNPSVPIMERVLLASIKEVIGKFLSDKEFTK